MKIKLLKSFRDYAIPVFLFFYVILHLTLTQSSNLSPWRIGGYGMYSTYHPDRNTIWLESDDNRIPAKDLSEVKDNSQLYEQLKICRTNPSDKNLIRLQSAIKENTGTTFKIEVWRPDFDTTAQNLTFILINSVENFVTK